MNDEARAAFEQARAARDAVIERELGYRRRVQELPVDPHAEQQADDRTDDEELNWK